MHAAQAGDAAWHFAEAMGHADVQAFLETEGASKEPGSIIVPEHVDKIKARASCALRARVCML